MSLIKTVRSKLARRVGLTLTEMVVVMAVCGVLALLLVPVVLRSRSGARTVVCADNLKGIGQAYFLCAQENKGVLSDAYYAFKGSDGTYEVSVKDPAAGTADKLMRADVSLMLTCPDDEDGVTVAAKTMNGAVGAARSSYAYNVALPLMFRNESRIRDAVNTVTFYDGDLGVVASRPWQHDMGWAADTVRERHHGAANYLFMDGHVETCAEFPDMAFDGGALWLASSLNTARPSKLVVNSGGPAAVPPENPHDPESPRTVDFIIDDGSVIPNENCDVTITCVGAAFQNGAGGERIPVAAYYSLDGGTNTRITSDVSGGESVHLTNVESGTLIATGGKTTQYFRTERWSDDGSNHTWVLDRGDTVPSIAGFDGQRSIEDFLRDYISPEGTVTIGGNDIIDLFELSNDIDYQRYSWADFQDVVVMITLEKRTYGVGGTININPNNRPDMEFTLTLPDGSLITRDDLAANKTRPGAGGFASQYLEYTGPATAVNFKPKGNGNQNGMTVDGSPYSVRNGNRYLVSSGNMTVRLYNSNQKNGKALGKWYIDITANDATISVRKSGKQPGF